MGASKAGEINVLRQHAPELAAQVFDSSRATEGFSLQEAAAMIAALDHLLFDSERSMLEKAYKDRGLVPEQVLTQEQLKSVMVDFIVYWLFGEEEAQAVLKDTRWESIAFESIPHWQEMKFMAADGDKVNQYVKSSFNTMRLIVTAGWCIYPLGYFFGYLMGAVNDDALNLVYN